MLIFHRHLSFRVCIPNWTEFYEWALRWIELDAWSSVTLAAAKVMVNANKFVIIAIEDHGRPLGSWRAGEFGVEAISWEFRFRQPLLHHASPIKLPNGSKSIAIYQFPKGLKGQDAKADQQSTKWVF